MKKKNEIEILENGTQFYMPDPFTGNSLLFEIGPDGSSSLQIIGQEGSNPLSVVFWPDDTIRFKEFILEQTKFKMANATKLCQAHYSDREKY